MSEDPAPYGAPQITAGPELDALVAEKVMGWGRIGKHWAIPVRDFCALKDDSPSPPRYSTDIEAAWTVMEKLAETCDVHIFKWFPEGWESDPVLREDETHHWICEISKAGTIPSDDQVEANADTAALAICLVALAWAKATAPEAGPHAR